MSTTESSQSTAGDAATQYRIELGDIRGVGSRTIEYLSDVGITSVRETHRLRDRGLPASQTLLSRGIDSDTLKHLRAVGEAIHSSGSERVESRHLTLPEANHIGDSSSISLRQEDAPTGGSGGDSNQRTLGVTSQPEYNPDMDALADALDTIQTEYDSGHNWRKSFGLDVGRFALSTDRFDDVDCVALPQKIVFSVVRDEHSVDQLTEQDAYKPEHGSLLIAFAEQL